MFSLILLLLTSCIANTINAEIAIKNLENQENIEKPVMWSGLGMMLFNTGNTSEFDSYVDTLLANGFTELRMSSEWHNWDAEAVLKSAIIRAITKGAKVIWGVESSSVELTSSSWGDFVTAVKEAALWAQFNGVYEFQLGNEEGLHNDNITLTDAQLIINLKALATEVQAIFTNGNVSYSCDPDYISNWIAAGKGDIDLLASNVYMTWGAGNPSDWQGTIDGLIGEFGANGTYLTEFGLNTEGLDNYSEDESIQAQAVTEMIEYIKASGMTRAIYFCYKDPAWLSGFGARKDDGTYRLLWDQALLNSESVKIDTVPTNTITISSPETTIALIPK